MSKSLMRVKAINLRKRGVSIIKIARVLGISKSTVSHWVGDVVLTVEQLEKLRENSIKGAELGRLRSAFLKRENRLKIIEDFKKTAIPRMSKLTERELMVTGLGLYWGEGGKTNRRIEFCNSDPRMIKFLTLWLTKCFGVNKENLICTVGINEIHTKREQVVREYWAGAIGVPLEQFRKTSFKRVKNKKVYENFNDHYGTLSVLVRRSTMLYYEIMGLIEALYKAT